jgi:hypothetical protein
VRRSSSISLTFTSTTPMSMLEQARVVQAHAYLSPPRCVTQTLTQVDTACRAL